MSSPPRDAKEGVCDRNLRELAFCEEKVCFSSGLSAAIEQSWELMTMLLIKGLAHLLTPNEACCFKVLLQLSWIKKSRAY